MLRRHDIGGALGCFEIDENLDVMLAGGAADGEDIVQGGKGLLNHEADVVFAAAS